MTWHQFALNWYHVPKHIQGLIFDYYEKLRASVTTKDWNTDFFSFDIGVFKSIDRGCLYRRKERFGLGLTSFTTYFEKLQVIKLHLVKHSPDPHVASLYHMRCNREKSHEAIWRPTRLLEKVSEMADFDHKFQHAAPGDKRGLGRGLFTNKIDNPTHREMCTQNVQRLADEKLEAHSQELAMQGSWLRWEQGVFPFDLSWDNLILGPGSRIVSFALNATHNPPSYSACPDSPQRETTFCCIHTKD